MEKKWSTVTIIVLLLVFIGYVVIDLVLRKAHVPNQIQKESEISEYPDKWIIDTVIVPGKGQLNSVSVSTEGKIIVGGESFVACYNQHYNMLWDYSAGMPVTALTVSGDRVYAAVQGIIIVLNIKGDKIDEWGPFEDNTMITSLASNDNYLAFADRANKKVYILDRKGEVKSIIVNPDEPFDLPGANFPVDLGKDNILYVANTGKRRIERRKFDGTLIDFFGEPGTGPKGFCGCCNPSYFRIIPEGFVTSEKGINRIKILDRKGKFVELVSSVNHFVPALPLDIASSDGRTIYGANPADSKLYVFKKTKEK